MLSVAGKPLGNGYIIAGDYNLAGNYSAFYCRIIDQYGNTNDFFDIDGSYNTAYRTILLGGSLSQTVDGNFILSGVVGADPTGMDRDFVVIKFDEFGSVIWKQLYEDSDELEGNAQIMPLANDNYLLYGWQYHVFSMDNYGPTKFYASKLDALGNKIWEHAYGSNANTLYAEQTQDGGFILSGYKYSSATGYDMYAVKTDSLGNLQWQQTYGTEHNDGGCVVMQTDDGNYILIGVISNVNGTEKKLYFTHINEDGNIIEGTEHMYSKNNNYGIEAPFIICSNNKIIAITVSFGPPPIWEFAFTILSPEGEILSETPISSGLPGEDYIRDIEPTPDGGYLLVGFNYTSPAKSWVLKVDSLGHTCGPAPCDSVAYPLQITPPLIEGGQGGEQTMQAQIYPNPHITSGCAPLRELPGCP